MDNHYHLLVCTPKANLSLAMTYINGHYARLHNISLKQDGPLFRGRYKSILIENDHYRLNVSRYIHLNPVEAGLVTSPEEYPWSSMAEYIGLKEKPNWLSKKVIESYFNPVVVGREYAEFVYQGIDRVIEEFYLSKKLLPILGSNEFVEKITREFSGAIFDDYELPEVKALVRNIKSPLINIVHNMARIMEISVKELTINCRGKPNTFRDISIVALVKYTEAPAK